MEDRREESRRVEFKPQRDHQDVEHKEDDVEQEEEATDRVAAAEIPRDWRGSLLVWVGEDASVGATYCGR